jgi:PTS system N-acetylglucosamine-specific IIC component
MKTPLAWLQPLGRALMLPIAVLPVAGLLLRLGQADLLNIPFIASAGDAVFSNLGLLFAIGVAVGFAKDSNGAAGLAGVVCFLVTTAGAKTLIHVPPDAMRDFAANAQNLAEGAFKDKALAKLSVPMGILSGIIAGNFYNRFSNVRMPDYIAFFGGRRFVPIISGLAGLALALAFGLGWSALSSGMDALSQGIVHAGPLGLFAYGFFNRLLIVTGLHHILNNVVWFLLGDYHGVTGDLHRFFAGDPTAGAFMSGFFPVMMFGLPAACLAMYHTARPEQRKAVGGMLLSLALTAFLTGVTEPIEFSFMFLAPVLYGLHAILTGLAMVVMNALKVKLGFGFSAGLFDYVLNFNKAARPLLLIPIGIVYGGLYYGLFRFFILRFDLKTPGRETEANSEAEAPIQHGSRPERFILALGGPVNLIEVGACTTRLRLVIADPTKVSDAQLRALGARGMIRPTPDTLQVVLGPIADQVLGEIRDELAKTLSQPHPLRSSSTDKRPALIAPESHHIADLAAALGGKTNIYSARGVSSRLCLTLGKQAIDTAALRAWGARSIVTTDHGDIHLIVGPGADDIAHAMTLELGDAAPPADAPH